MAATLILADHTGRLGNRVLLYAHVLAAAEEYGCRVVNLSLLAASHYFQGLHLNPWGSYPTKKFPVEIRWLTRSLRAPLQAWVRGRRGKFPVYSRWLRVLDMENQPTYALDSPGFAQLVQTTRFIILWGYPFRCPTLVRRHREKIGAFFRFRPETAPGTTARLAAARARGKKILAIHVRLDDVVNEDWRYVPPETYARALDLFLRQHPGESWEVYVCSDGVIPESLFPPGAVTGVPRPLAEDLALLTGSDVVMGFDSSLSIAAAFLSGHPFLRVDRENASFNESPDLFFSL